MTQIGADFSLDRTDSNFRSDYISIAKHLDKAGYILVDIKKDYFTNYEIYLDKTGDKRVIKISCI